MGMSISFRQRVPAGDGCNMCTCQLSGQVTCENRLCRRKRSTGQVKSLSGCQRNGTVIKIGETFKDDCNMCQCTKRANGEATINCTKKICGCQDSSQSSRVFKVGEKWQKEDNCVSCECLDSFKVKCVKICNVKNRKSRVIETAKIVSTYNNALIKNGA